MTKGPKLPISKEIHATKYRAEGESFEEAQARFANALAESPKHFKELYNILLDQRFMGGGRTQAAVGSPRCITPFNCFVSGTIEDSMSSIMCRASEAAETMRLGGGIGYDFSKLRPRGDRIVTLESQSSGPVSFMSIFDAVCNTIAGAGHRRGAQMGVLRVDHPDIEEFLQAKQNDDKLRAFNISIGVTNKFMQAVENGDKFPLVFDGKTYKYVDARNLWERIMRSTWEWAEPGVLFIDTINEMNNLWYCEEIAATNPCGEQPLPPYGACLLGSFNLTKYLMRCAVSGERFFDYDQFMADIPVVVLAMDNIHDIATFPLYPQQDESWLKRRMGLGLTGVANTIEALGCSYGDGTFLEHLDNILRHFQVGVYRASCQIAKMKGPFPMYNRDLFMQSKFIQTLPEELRDEIYQHGVRNSHLLSIAPTGTISLSADNVSGGIEPVFSHYYDRTIQTFDGQLIERVSDYAYREWGIKGKTAGECSAKEHLDVLALATKYVDSACSKTINVSPDMPWDEFKKIYMDAWKAGCKGCTTFNPGGKRFGILNEIKEDDGEDEAKACYIDPTTGKKSCD